MSGILWAEDNPLDRQLIREALSQVKAPPITFVADRVELLESLRVKQPSLVVVDLQMPRMGGLQALEALRWPDSRKSAAEGLNQPEGDGRILWANHAEAAMLGYTREEYIGRSLADIHADPEVLERILATLRAGGEVRGQPARLRTRD